MTNPVKLLSDDALREIEARHELAEAAFAPYQEVGDSLADIPALCQTVRALRERYESLKSKIAWHRDGVGPNVPVLQDRYDRLMAQRTALTTGLVNIYHVITNEECDRAVALGMATSAVSSLLNQNTAMREQLAQAQIDLDGTIKLWQRYNQRLSQLLQCAATSEEVEEAVKHLVSQLAQVTQERDRAKEDLRILTQGRFMPQQ